MSGYPAPYDPTTDFSAEPSFDKAKLDPEFDNLATTLAVVIDMLKSVLRDDYALIDGIVTKNALQPSLYTLLLNGSSSVPAGNPGGTGNVLPAPNTGPGFFALVGGVATEFYWSDGTTWFLLGTFQPAGFKPAVEEAVVFPVPPLATTVQSGDVELATDDEVNAFTPSGSAGPLVVAATSMRRFAGRRYWVHQAAVLGMSVRVDGGYYVQNGLIYTSPAASLTIGPAHVTLDRYDIVAAAVDGSLQVIPGTPSVTPDFPALVDANLTPLAAVKVLAATTTVQDGNIIDLRQTLKTVSEELGYTPADRDGDVFTGPVSGPSADFVDLKVNGVQVGKQFPVSGTCTAAAVGLAAVVEMMRITVTVAANRILKVTRARSYFADAGMRLRIRLLDAGAVELGAYTTGSNLADEAPVAMNALCVAAAGARICTLVVAAYGNAAGNTVTTDGFALGLSFDDSAAAGAPPGVDTDPSPFSFTAQSNVQLLTLRTSNSIVPVGYDAPAPITVAGMPDSKYSLNGGAFTAAAGTINPGDTVRVQHTTSNAISTTDTTTLTIGTTAGSFQTTTRSAPSGGGGGGGGGIIP